MTKYHRQSGLKNKILLSPGFGDWKSEIKMVAGLASQNLGLQMTTFPMCPHWSFLREHTALMFLGVSKKEGQSDRLRAYPTGFVLTQSPL